MSVGNKPIGDPNVGPKDDFVKVPFTPADSTLMAYAVTGYYHIHGKAFVYPSLADDVTLTSSGSIWDASTSLIEVVPAGALNLSAFDLHYLNISDISGNATIQIDIYSGDIGEEVLIGGSRATRTPGGTRNGPQPIQVPQQSSGTRISCRLTASVASTTTCEVSFSGHYYGDV